MRSPEKPAPLPILMLLRLMAGLWPRALSRPSNILPTPGNMFSGQ
jgi:hypothetical protein